MKGRLLGRLDLLRNLVKQIASQNLEEIIGKNLVGEDTEREIMRKNTILQYLCKKCLSVR